MFVGLATFVVFLARPSALTWHMWNGWNVVLIVANYVQLSRQGHLASGAERAPLEGGGVTPQRGR